MKLTAKLCSSIERIKTRKLELNIYKTGYTDVEDYKGFRRGISFSYRKKLTGEAKAPSGAVKNNYEEEK